MVGQRASGGRKGGRGRGGRRVTKGRTDPRRLGAPHGRLGEPHGRRDGGRNGTRAPADAGGDPRGGSARWVVYTVLSFIAAVSVLLVILMQFMNLAGLMAALTLVPRGLMFTNVPVGLGFFTLGGPAAVVYFAFIAVMVFISLGAVWHLFGKGFLAALAKMVRKRQPPSPGGGNGLLVVAELFLAVIFIDLAWDNFLGLFSSGITVPAGLAQASQWELMFRLAEASVVEEFQSRVLLIGVPLFIIHSAAGERKGRGVLRYLWGGGFRMTPVVVLLIFLSGLIFGYLHLGWQWTKVPPTVLSGFAFGYLYARFGLGASIMFHFTFNYLNILPGYLGWSAALDLLYSILLLLIYLAGPFLLYVYARRAAGFARRHWRMGSREAWGKASAAAAGALLFAGGMGGLLVVGGSYAAFSRDPGAETTQWDGLIQLEAGEYRVVELGPLGEGGAITVEIRGTDDDPTIMALPVLRSELGEFQSCAGGQSWDGGGRLDGVLNLTSAGRLEYITGPGEVGIGVGRRDGDVLPGTWALVVLNPYTDGGGAHGFELAVTVDQGDADGSADETPAGSGSLLVCMGAGPAVAMVMGVVVMFYAPRFSLGGPIDSGGFGRKGVRP